ncbi:MAG: hypothetical protein AAF629_35410 [Chloroflexota bacterium]
MVRLNHAQSQQLQLRLSPSIRSILFVGLISLWALFGLTACGGDDDGSSGNTAAATEDVEIGKVISGDGWSIEVTAPTEKAQLIGEGQIVYRSEEGVFIIVFVKAKNDTGVLQVVPRDLFLIVDSQGREYKATKSAIQVGYGLLAGMTVLLDAPMKVGETRESLLTYDVPNDATELKLKIKGTDQTIALGF